MLRSPLVRKLVEPVPITDDFCMECAVIEAVGPCGRFVFMCPQTAYETGEKMLSVKSKILLPIGAIQPMINLALRFLADQQEAGQHIIDLVK